MYTHLNPSKPKHAGPSGYRSKTGRNRVNGAPDRFSVAEMARSVHAHDDKMRVRGVMATLDRITALGEVIFAEHS
jgi:hypothetical protein